MTMINREPSKLVVVMFLIFFSPKFLGQNLARVCWAVSLFCVVVFLSFLFVDHSSSPYFNRHLSFCFPLVDFSDCGG
jgi:hypothetical protein